MVYAIPLTFLNIIMTTTIVLLTNCYKRQQDKSDSENENETVENILREYEHSKKETVGNIIREYESNKEETAGSIMREQERKDNNQSKSSAMNTSTPVFIEKPEDTEKLVWNPACVNNLAVYLPKMAKDKKVGIIAKPCDIRSIITLIQERQVKRENLFIIGLGCGGVVDAFNLDNQDFHLQEVTAVEWEDASLKVTTTTGIHTLPKSDCQREMCGVCTKQTPAIFDVELGEPIQPEECGVCALPELPEQRRKYWSEEFAKCIRCYACRQVCPACYCETALPTA